MPAERDATSIGCRYGGDRDRIACVGRRASTKIECGEVVEYIAMHFVEFHGWTDPVWSVLVYELGAIIPGKRYGKCVETKGNGDGEAYMFAPHDSQPVYV